MQKRQIKLTPPHTAQQQMLDERRRFNVVCTGRRAGKTELLVHLACIEAIRGGYVGNFAPVYSQLMDTWRRVIHILGPVIREKSVEQKRIELENGGTLELFSLDSDSADTVRGKRFSLALVDEAAMVTDLDNAFWSVIRPTLTDLSGGCWMLSTPNGLNAFYRFWLLGQDPLNAEWKSWKLSSTSNPYIDPEEIRSAKLNMPAWRFEAEYEGGFLDSGSGIFRYIDQAIHPGLPIEKPVRGHSYVIGCDIGRVKDFTCFAVIDEQERSLVFLDRFTNLDFALQVSRLKALVDRFRPMMTLVEANNFGIAFIESARKAGMRITPFQTTNATKAAAIESLAAAFEQREISIPNDPVLLSELRTFMVTTTATGLSRYSAPLGLHDDCALALAIAWAGVSGVVERPRVPRIFWLDQWQPGSDDGRMDGNATLEAEKGAFHRVYTRFDGRRN